MCCSQLTKFLPSYIGEVLDEAKDVVERHQGVVAHLKVVDECDEVQVLEIVQSHVGTCEE